MPNYPTLRLNQQLEKVGSKENDQACRGAAPINLERRYNQDAPRVVTQATLHGRCQEEVPWLHGVQC